MKRSPIKSDRTIKACKPEAKEYLVKVANYPKLSLMVRPNGTKSWIYRYNHPDSHKQKKMSFGTYPSTSLERVREIWRINEDLLKQQIDPKTHRDEQAQIVKEQQCNTFADISREWQAWQADYHKISKSTQNSNERYLSYARNAFGDKPITAITPPMILNVCKVWEAQGKHETANRIKLKCSQVFGYACSLGKCQYDPTTLLKGALVAPKPKHHPSIIEPEAFGQLLKDLDSLNTGINIIHSLKLLALLFPRNGDLRNAKWCDFDLSKAMWSLKPQKGSSREDMMTEIILPLPTQAIEILKEQYKLTGHTDLVFFSSRAKKERVISENTAGQALNKGGYKGVHCPHGFRASAKTMLMERLNYNDALTELQLGHKVRDIHGTAYNRTAFFDKRAEMAQSWADYLDKLRG